MAKKPKFETYYARDPATLPKAELVEIVRAAQNLLYADTGAEGYLVWDPDKDVNGADFIELMARFLAKHGLTPHGGPKEWRPKGR